MGEHFEILIDASGSMGHMKGTKFENKFLLPDAKTTRMELAKKILINSVFPKLSFVEKLSISTFLGNLQYDNLGNKIPMTNGKAKFNPASKIFYSDSYDEKNINLIVSKIENPAEAGTPLAWILVEKISKSNINKLNIIVLSDGDDSIVEKFDEEVLNVIRKSRKECKIYFIGIDQDKDAIEKSKNLAQKTNGFYVNLKIVNYDEAIFDSMLFEFNTTITSNALKENLKIETTLHESIATSNEKREIKNIIEVEREVKSVKIETSKKNDDPINLHKQVYENTKSLQLITSQLDSIVKQISFIGKEKANDEDEFIANDDEERNRVIGYQCEKYINSVLLKNKWEKVNWLNENAERSKPYDFDVTVKGINYYIECKGSTSNSKEFFLTKNEWLFYLANRKNYRLYFVSEINSQNPTVHRIEDLLKDMEQGKLIACSSINRKVKADRILFQIIN
ncbi:MAG: DUF3883 domain-containing protein [Flavobacterium sp.]|nr:DUF3883 domain-containing protein [Flavobacterium sp.]